MPKPAKRPTPALDLIEFLNASPSPYHAVQEIARRLEARGFTALEEADKWSLTPGDKHYVVRAGTSIIAFVVGEAPPEHAGFKLLGAHTDSPCLKLKPKPDMYKQNYVQLAVEVYGGAILATWVDRDLGLAGRVTHAKGAATRQTLVLAHAPLLRVPSLAIHLHREVNKDGLKLNPQTQMVPVLGLSQKPAGQKPAEQKLEGSPARALLASLAGVREADVLDFDICLFDTQPAALLGQDDDFIVSARLDNLASCHAGLAALEATCARRGDATRVLVCYDHEEVGSTSAQGAASPFLRQTLERIVQARAADPGQALARALARSFFISADMAHAVHPNFSELHDAEHMPKIGQGPVIKHNVNQNYATDGASAAVFSALCTEAEVTPQRFVMRGDLACGSTIGPITAAELGVATVDVGCPMLSMHSAREMAGSADVGAMVRVIERFWR